MRLLEVYPMNEESEFTVSGFKRRVRGSFRADKGKKHNYPKERKAWYPKAARGN
jgi:hypothetical protein